MLKETVVINTKDIKDVVRVFDNNFTVFAGCINDNHLAIAKLAKKKASKVSVAIAIIAGIVYIIKNELDKDDINFALIEQDKRDRGCYCSRLESEREALDPANI